MGKRYYRVFRVFTVYDDCGAIIRTEKQFAGYTMAASEKAAANNVRFREKAGYGRSFSEGFADSSTVRTYEAVLA